MTQIRYSLRRRLMTLRWAIPIALACLAVFYEMVPGRWLHDTAGALAYFDVDILFYGIAAPLLAFWGLTVITNWLDKIERAERQARASEQRLASIMAASADAILSLDAAGAIESWNSGAELIFGFSQPAILGRSLASLFGPGDSAAVELGWLTEAVQRAGYVRGHETTCRDADGREVAVELTATRLGGDDERPAGMSVILRDVSDRKRREEEIRSLNATLSQQVADRTRELAEKVAQLAQANVELRKLDQTRAEFVSLVSHQIRAPLTNMRGAAERMQTDCGAINNTCARMFVIFDQQVGRLDRLVRDVLQAARLETGEVSVQAEPISVLPVIQQVVEQTRARRVDRPIHLPTKPGLPLVFADRDRVSEVLTNLLDNADKYSPPGTPITVDVQADQLSVTFSVRDSGRGVPPADLDRVFDKFYRADNSDSQAAYGHGLGLYICRRLIEAQGGRIWAENPAGGGAVFSFTLPAAA
jgi:PAS domain S-box-containing protein